MQAREKTAGNSLTKTENVLPYAHLCPWLEKKPQSKSFSREEATQSNVFIVHKVIYVHGMYSMCCRSIGIHSTSTYIQSATYLVLNR